MKCFSTLLFVFMTLVSAKGQTIPIDSFYVPGAQWTEGVGFSWWDEPEDGDWVSDYGVMGRVFGIIGDTTVSGIFYRKLGLSAYGGYGFYNSLNCRVEGPCAWDSSYGYSSNPLSLEYIGRVRIDSNRVYFILDKTHTSFDYFTTGSFIPGHEYLLYDFNIALGSPFNSGLCYDSGDSVVTIDSVLLSNGTHVSRYTDSVGYYWIWGIGQPGGSYGAYNPWWCIYVDEPMPGPGNEYGSSVVLCYNNPSFSYHFSYTDTLMLPGVQNSCFDVNLLPPPYDHSSPSIVQYVNKLPDSSIIIFPNPSINSLTIRSSEPITHVTISNLLGQTIFTQDNNTNTAKIDVSTFQTGLYFIKINDGEVKKFLKE